MINQRTERLLEKLDEKDLEIEKLKEKFGHLASESRDVSRDLAGSKERVKTWQEKVKELELELQGVKEANQKLSDVARVRVKSQTEIELEITALQRELVLKDLEIKVLKQKQKAIKEENVTVRMQLLDPSNIKRDPQDEMEVQEFTRVQQQFDAVALQEELKQMILESTLLKDKIVDMQEKFKKIDEQRDKYIADLRASMESQRQTELKMKDQTLTEK